MPRVLLNAEANSRDLVRESSQEASSAACVGRERWIATALDPYSGRSMFMNQIQSFLSVSRTQCDYAPCGTKRISAQSQREHDGCGSGASMATGGDAPMRWRRPAGMEK
eukprot:5793486-Pleurochrysis_carterae.AAC.3